MSRQQWGHGYWKGREDASKNPDGPRYIGVFDADDPFINRVAQIRERYGDTLVVEWIDYFDIQLAIYRGYEPSWEDIVGRNVEQICLQELKCEYKFYNSWLPVAGEYIKGSQSGWR